MFLRGTLIRSPTIRGGHASLAIVTPSDSKDGAVKVVLVVIRFGGSEWKATRITDENASGGSSSISNGQSSQDMQSFTSELIARMRSNVRRMCKIGNELEFVGSFEEQKSDPPSTNKEVCGASDIVGITESSFSFYDWDRFVVDYHLQPNHKTCEIIRLVQAQKWDATKCQMLQKKYFPTPIRNQQRRPKQGTYTKENKDSVAIHHKSGLGKRQMGEVVADFLLHVISTMHSESDGGNGGLRTTVDAEIMDKFNGYEFKNRIVPYTTYTAGQSTHAAKLLEQRQIISNERQHSGCILDVAGGAGHVSLALALRNIKSTVVDPRATVGNLPGRDRKMLKKSEKEPFKTYRAWFGSRPEGIDTFFREGCQDYFLKTSSGHKSLQSLFDTGEKEKIPVCTIDSDDQLLPNCSAIVALHPDEATGIIVETAVKHRIPFVVVLFPDRLTSDGRIVSTYFELVEWLVAKDSAINVSLLPFGGANLALWATF